MTLGGALVVIFVLYLLDEHDCWRQVLKGAKITGYWLMWTALVCAIVAGGWFGWTKWSDYHATRREAEISVPQQFHMDASVSQPDPLDGLGVLAVPNSPTAVDCYDAQGNLLPNDAEAFGGITIECGKGLIAKFKTARASLPLEMRLRVEQIESCQKKVAEEYGGKAEFKKCAATRIKK